MINQWLKLFNWVIVLLAIMIASVAVYYHFKHSLVIEDKGMKSGRVGLPKTSFEMSSDVYHGIGGPLLGLQDSPPTLQVPDLRSELVYYGKNGRPDAQDGATLLHFAVASHPKNVISVRPGEPTYLVYDRSTSPGHYVFSVDNEQTSLSFTAKQIESEAEIHVTFENEKGEIVKEPMSHIEFRLPEKEFSRALSGSWELGSFRVDATLLARQKAKWYGTDTFLEQHGGEDYSFAIGRQRVDLGENENSYFIFAKVGDTFIWHDDQWKAVTPGINSLGQPLLYVKKVDDRLMSFELWDVDGKGKILLNLLKTTEPWALQNPQALSTMFKFMGARTRSQCVFEINRERMVLSPSDWLLLTNKGWKKLSTVEDIDSYVKRKQTGTLFIFEGVARKDEKQILKGKLYSPARQTFQEIELSLQTGNGQSTKVKLNKETKDSKEQDLQDAKEVANLIGEILAPLKHEHEAKNSNGVKVHPTQIGGIKTPQAQGTQTMMQRVPNPTIKK